MKFLLFIFMLMLGISTTSTAATPPINDKVIIVALKAQNSTKTKSLATLSSTVGVAKRVAERMNARIVQDEKAEDMYWLILDSEDEKEEALKLFESEDKGSFHLDMQSFKARK